jgi:hypothetical protein
VIALRNMEVWFAAGSQHLYGEAVVQTVAEHSRRIVEGLSGSKAIPLDIVLKPVLTTADAIGELCREANGSRRCAGIIAWMHTFSPREDVAGRTSHFDEAFGAFAHAIQPRSSLEFDRHGFHEPESIRSRGSRVRTPRDATGPEAQGRRGSLGGAGCSGKARNLDPCRSGLA